MSTDENKVWGAELALCAPEHSSSSQGRVGAVKLYHCVVEFSIWGTWSTPSGERTVWNKKPFTVCG